MVIISHLSDGTWEKLKPLISFVMAFSIEYMQKLMSLFVSIHGRKPVDYAEFEAWVELYESNIYTLNSRREIK